MATLLGSLLVSLGLESAQFRKGMTEAERAMKVAQQKFDRIGTKMESAGKKLSLAITAPVVAFGAMSFKAASDAAELQDAFDRTFGAMSKDMNQWAEEAGNAMGRATQVMQQGAFRFGVILNQIFDPERAAKMSQALAERAVDLGSLFNVDDDVAMQKLRAGLAGEAEPLKEFGVLMNEGAVKAKALELGIIGVGEAMTEEQKVAARYALIMEQTSDAQGNAVETSKSTSNQLKKAAAAFQELQVAIGTKLLPALTPLIDKLTKALEWFTKLPGPIQDTVMVSVALAAALGPVLFVIGNLISILSVGPFLAFASGLTGIGVASGVAATGATAAGIAIRTAILAVSKAALAFMLNPVVLGFTAVLIAIFAAWKNWDKIKPILDGVGKAVTDFWNRHVKPALDAVGKAIVGTIQFFMNLRQNATQAIIQMGAAIFAKLGEIAGKMLAIGRQIITGLVNGIKANAAAVWNALKDVVMGGINRVRGWLGIKSPSRVFMGIGGFITQGLAIGIASEESKTTMAMRSVVDGILNEMRRIDGLADEAKEELTELRSLMDRLFPAQARQRQFEIDKATIDGSGLSDELKGEANKRLIDDSFPEIRQALATMVEGTKNAFGQVGDTVRGAFVGVLDNVAEKTEVQTVRIAESFKDMADKALGALRTLVDGIKGGGFLDILQGAIGLFTQLGSMGVFGKSIQTNLNKTPAYANGTRFHPGGLALVGERGPELVNMARGSSVLNAQATKGALGGGRMQVAVTVENGNLRAFVRNESGQLIAQSAPGIMAGGAQMAGNDLTWQQSRRLG